MARFNGKVRCISGKGNCFDKGIIYDVVDGSITDKHGDTWPEDFYSIRDLNLYFTSQFELVTEEPAQFTKDMLKTGMRVKYRNGEIRIILLGTDNDGDVLINNEHWYWLREFDNDLIYTSSFSTFNPSSFDIIEVYEQPFVPTEILDPSKCGELIWKRKEPRKMTKAEAEKYISEHMEETIIINE